MVRCMYQAPPPVSLRTLFLVLVHQSHSLITSSTTSTPLLSLSLSLSLVFWASLSSSLVVSLDVIPPCLASSVLPGQRSRPWKVIGVIIVLFQHGVYSLVARWQLNLIPDFMRVAALFHEPGGASDIFSPSNTTSLCLPTSIVVAHCCLKHQLLLTNPRRYLFSRSWNMKQAPEITDPDSATR